MPAISKSEQSLMRKAQRYLPEGLQFGLRNYWYPVLQSGQLPRHKPLGFCVLNESFVAWRGEDGKPNVVHDRCPHRCARLSAGRVLSGQLQCAWHGVRFNGEGQCTLIPWEPDDSHYRHELKIPGYPAEDRGGWIWVYIGDPQKFPPPPLTDVMPEELLKPDEFIVFTHPIDVWKCNWLHALDGSDGYHAVMLHSESQLSSLQKLADDYKPAPELVDRRMEIVDTPQGLRGIVLDQEGKQIHHGHFMDGWKGERWTLPGLFSLPISPAPNVQPYVARLYQFAVDASHTQTSRWVAMRACNEQERERCSDLWEKVIGPRQRRVVQEDQEICETLGDIFEARANEFLFTVDRDVIAVRKMMADAWNEQLEGRRPMPSKEAFAFPA
jgi:phenylpropionate dioxygenase-like ring-hydroxylating dioxygenase large terminal subunit